MEREMKLRFEVIIDTDKTHEKVDGDDIKSLITNEDARWWIDREAVEVKELP
jgi:hypothetical protein